MGGGWLGSVLAIAGLGVGAALCGCGGDAFTSAGPDSGLDTASIGADARAPDGAPGDAAVDAPMVPAPDAGAGWCATQSAAHTFCEDFLHGVPDKLVGITANAMLVPDTTDTVSAPQSMAAITPKLPAKGDSATALATRDFSGATGTQFTLSSYFKIASSCFPSSGQVDPVSIALLDFPDASYGLALEIAPNAVALVELETGADGGITGSPEITTLDTPDLFDNWQLWTLTIDGGLTKSVTLSVGGTTVTPARTMLKKPQTTLLLQHPTLFLGAAVKNDQGLSPGCKVNVDDILFDVKAVATPAN
jgi:hypothetical protein